MQAKIEKLTKDRKCPGSKGDFSDVGGGARARCLTHPATISARHPFEMRAENKSKSTSSKRKAWLNAGKRSSCGASVDSTKPVVHYAAYGQHASLRGPAPAGLRAGKGQ